jgi:hypothetical protein
VKFFRKLHPSTQPSFVSTEQMTCSDLFLFWNMIRRVSRVAWTTKFERDVRLSQLGVANDDPVCHVTSKLTGSNETVYFRTSKNSEIVFPTRYDLEFSLKKTWH